MPSTKTKIILMILSSLGRVFVRPILILSAFLQGPSFVILCCAGLHYQIVYTEIAVFNGIRDVLAAY